MASLGAIDAELGGLEPTLKRALMAVFRYLVPNLQFGPVDHQTKSLNHQAWFLTSTTATSTSEFSIVHGLGRTPYLAIPVLALGSSATGLIPLEVTRPADTQRVYLKTTANSTGKVFSLLVE